MSTVQVHGAHLLARAVDAGPKPLTDLHTGQRRCRIQCLAVHRLEAELTTRQEGLYRLLVLLENQLCRVNTKS